MRRLGLGLLPFFVLVGCHGPADDFSKVDLANPPLAADWVQFRNGPAGYAFQAPKDWGIDPGMEATALLARSNLETSPLLRILSLPAARQRQLVSFAFVRFIVPSEARGELKVTNLDDLAEKARQGMANNLADVKHERLTLDTGPAEHVWGTMDRVEADGSRRKMTSNILVLTTALHTYVAMYGYPSDREAEYRPTLDRIVRTIRLFVPEKGGEVTIPESARIVFRNAPASAPSGTSAPAYTQAPAWGSPPPSTGGETNPPPAASSGGPSEPAPSAGQNATTGGVPDPGAPNPQGAPAQGPPPQGAPAQGAPGSEGAPGGPPQEPPAGNGGSANPPGTNPPGAP